MSHDYSGSLNLNSRRKPIETRKEGELKGGIKRDAKNSTGESVFSENSLKIFDALNSKDSQGNTTDAILDADEIDKF